MIKTAKEFLNQGFRINERINSKLEQVAMLRELAVKTSNTLSDMPGNPNKGRSRVEETLTRIYDLEEDINKDIDRLVDLKKQIMDAIESVKDPQESLLLNLRYLNFLTWEEIAFEMGFTVRNVHMLHSKALKNIKVPR